MKEGKFPNHCEFTCNWYLTYTVNYWSNEPTMMGYLHILISYVTRFAKKGLMHASNIVIF